ncbi:hypothetical protein TSAR_016338 [Trichomalopsis sarcophagae]|uniref:Uncharacterized protein n=1 Tax=Trichomalopsis sarcophagae TaxID=543379 RepID=A0A232FAL7_9HYME|nr:hypothetical protein TSAR_016338 [Trichomalopsis sarcophagae]
MFKIQDIFWRTLSSEETNSQTRKMRVLCLSAIVCFLAYLECARATPYADPFAEPDPGLGNKVGEFCNSTMTTATSHKDFCKHVSKKVVDKVHGICQKAVNVVCKFFKEKSKKRKKCLKWLGENVCPTFSGNTTTESVSTETKAPLAELKA